MTIRLVWPVSRGLFAFGPGSYRPMGRVFRFLLTISIPIRIIRDILKTKKKAEEPSSDYDNPSIWPALLGLMALGAGPDSYRGAGLPLPVNYIYANSRQPQ